jgi:hypothetical protein
MQPDSVLVAMDTTRPSTMVTVNSPLGLLGTHQAAEGGSSSLSSTQKDQPPACVGVPLSKPSEATAPVARLPLSTVNS